MYKFSVCWILIFGWLKLIIEVRQDTPKFFIDTYCRIRNRLEMM